MLTTEVSFIVREYFGRKLKSIFLLKWPEYSGVSGVTRGWLRFRFRRKKPHLSREFDELMKTGFVFLVFLSELGGIFIGGCGHNGTLRRVNKEFIKFSLAPTATRVTVLLHHFL